MVDETVSLKQGALSFPRSGKFVTESHYATSEESFSNGLFPSSVSERIEDHLEASCELLRTVYGASLNAHCSDLYDKSWEREWTPPEGGKAGQAAVGDRKPTRIQELWQGNMMYASGGKPAPGTKYIITNPSTGKSVVISMGFEVGPADTSRFLGGVTTEVQWALGNKSQESTNLKIGRAKDQNLPYGPVQCN